MEVTVSTAEHSSGRARLTEPSLGHAVSKLRQWQNLLSPTGHTYRSLNRMVTNLPRGVPGHLVCRLTRVTLSRPITDRLELLLVTLYMEAHRFRDIDPEVQKVFVAARAPEIRVALRRVARHTRNNLRVTRLRDLRFFVSFLLDFRGPHAGTIAGLARKAVRWHRRQLARERARIVDRYGADTRVQMPSISVPADSAIHHLETVGDIAREGERMAHCVAGYIPEALKGYYHIFHVAYQGEEATVMVHRDGQVVDTQGSRNRRNGAAQWGGHKLSEWARGLRTADAQRAG